MPWRSQSLPISRQRSFWLGNARSQSCRRVKAACLAASVEVEIDAGGLGDHHLERDPPQVSLGLREVAGDIDRERCVKFAHDRQREIPVVTIAVVEGEGGETPREISFAHPAVHLVHGDDVDAARPQVGEDRAQEFWRDFEMAVGLKRHLACRPHVMQHENAADAGENRAKQVVRTGEIKRFQAGADDVAA